MHFNHHKLTLIIFFAATVFGGCKKNNLLPVPPLPPVNVDSLIPPGKPNIILILGDDVGYEIPTYTGGESYSTPNMDRMANLGLQFSKCYSSPLCSPSRFALLTGKYNFRNYYDTSWGSMDLSQRTIANMLKGAGYATCAVGKWQLNGGDSAIKTFGFQKYSLATIYKFGSTGDDESGEGLYKNPQIWQEGKGELSETERKNKYGEDVNLQYMFNFMDSNKSNPFFVYWAPNLCHKPFCPTPDDPEFASWDPDTHIPSDADSIFFPSMVKYYDKEIGMLLDKLQSSSYGSNTIVILIVGDNGTTHEINSKYKGEIVHGGKGQYYDAGIHEPMIVYWPGKVASNAINANLVDFVDFFPSIAQLTNTALPLTYGPLDGISFVPEIFGFTQGSNLRQYSFNWYNPDRYGPDPSPTRIWAMDTAYKQYDSVKQDGFFHYTQDPMEQSIIKSSQQTDKEKGISSNLQSIIEKYKEEAH